MLIFLIKCAASQSSIYPVVLMRLGGSCSKSNLLKKLQGGCSGNWTYNLMVRIETCWRLNQWGGYVIYIIMWKILSIHLILIDCGYLNRCGFKLFAQLMLSCMSQSYHYSVIHCGFTGSQLMFQSLFIVMYTHKNPGIRISHES